MTVGTVIWIIILILLLNTTAAIITVFKEKRDIAATWAWLLVLNLLPVVGFVIYLFAGKKISKEKIKQMADKIGSETISTTNQSSSVLKKIIIGLWIGVVVILIATYSALYAIIRP